MVRVNRTGCNVQLLSTLCAAQFIVMAMAGTNLYAASVNLAWNANIESDLAGYRIYYGTTSGNYTSSQETGRVTSYTLSNLTEGRTYYIAMTAFDTTRNESRRSSEIRGIASSEEPAVSEEETVYEDAEEGDTTGWTIYDNLPAGAEIDNVYDGDRQSYVIELTGYGTGNGFRLGESDGSRWHNENQTVIQWSMNYSELFIVYIDLETTAGHRYLTYRPLDYDLLGQGEYIYFGLGSEVIDGEWHTFVRDLQADLNVAQPGVIILEVNGFLIRGSGMVDDISMLSDLVSGGGFSTTIEAEDMSYHTNGARAGDFWNLWSNGTMRDAVYLPADGSYRFTITAKATLANAVGAETELLIDGEPVGSVFVNSTTPQTYAFLVELSEGLYDIAIGFCNDYYRPAEGIDRNLLVDKMEIALTD